MKAHVYMHVQCSFIQLTNLKSKITFYARNNQHVSSHFQAYTFEERVKEILNQTCITFHIFCFSPWLSSFHEGISYWRNERRWDEAIIYIHKYCFVRWIFNSGVTLLSLFLLSSIPCKETLINYFLWN